MASEEKAKKESVQDEELVDDEFLQDFIVEATEHIERAQLLILSEMFQGLLPEFLIYLEFCSEPLVYLILKIT